MSRLLISVKEALCARHATVAATMPGEVKEFSAACGHPAIRHIHSELALHGCISAQKCHIAWYTLLVPS